MTIQKACIEASLDHFRKPKNTVPSDNNVDEKPSSCAPPMTATFPEKLMYILDNEDMYGNNASWLPDGRSFVIRSPHQFAEEVLPHFFSRGCKFDSFMRKLYYWGFKKTKSKGRGAEVKFHHKNFCRGSAPSCMHLRTLKKSFQKNYLKSISANKINGNDNGRDTPASSDEGEPSTLDTNEAHMLRLVKEAIDIHDQKSNFKIVPLGERSHAEYPLMTKQVQYQRPLDSIALSCLQQLNGLFQSPIRQRPLQPRSKVPHQIGNAFQGRNIQNTFLTTTSLKPFYQLDGTIPTTNTYTLPAVALQRGNAASMLPGTNVVPFASQQNIANLSSFLNNISTLRQY